jgi:hypothetical protein
MVPCSYISTRAEHNPNPAPQQHSSRCPHPTCRRIQLFIQKPLQSVTAGSTACQLAGVPPHPEHSAAKRPGCNPQGAGLVTLNSPLATDTQLTHSCLSATAAQLVATALTCTAAPTHTPCELWNARVNNRPLTTSARPHPLLRCPSPAHAASAARCPGAA